MKQISVIGPSNPSEKVERLAYKIGEIIGDLGFVLVCGGRGGVMEQASCGAKNKGGITVGILPGDFDDANPCVDIKIPTHMNELRNFLVVSSGNIVVSVGLSDGTLIELAIAKKLNKTVFSFLLPDTYRHLAKEVFNEQDLDKFKEALLLNA